ncbi:MAG: DUF3540 domain-containing protein [Candidatus Eisenbacteria bacterium]|nr:DUF3540 domain-containing protein [Candidatus Eisenbacteria bacterium]
METQACEIVTPVAAPDLILGPAIVRGAMEGALLVDIHGELHRAQMALVYPYRPVPGDIVLVLGQGDTLYVTGVLDGKGLTRLDFPGDVELRAAGKLRLGAKEGVELDSEQITMRADRLVMTVTTVRQQMASLYQHVTGTLRTIAGRQRTSVEGHSTLHAKKIIRKAEDDVIVDGRTIKLG